MNIVEIDLEDLIFQDLITRSGSTLLSRGLNLHLLQIPVQRTYWHRQVTLGDYGICDIVGYTRFRGSILVDLIELKNRPIKSEDFDQLMRYKTAIKGIIKNTFSKNVCFHISTYLIGPGIEDGHYIQNNMPVNLTTFTFNVDGFRFTHHHGGWIRSSSENLNLHHLRLDTGIVVEHEIEIEEEEEPING
jgi:hypothetical protein